MTSNSKKIVLSRREFMYLTNTDFLPKHLAQIISTAEYSDTDAYLIPIPLEIMEDFRSAFTERLARAGFDANYEPTAEGEMLENLIDRFFMKK